MDTATNITIMANNGARAEGLDPAALYRLLAWLSPAYPVGAFSYSSGIEWRSRRATSVMRQACEAGSPS